MKSYQKNAFSGFCQKFPQAMDEVEKFFLPISKSLGGALGCQGWVVIPQNVKKSQNHCTLLYKLGYEVLALLSSVMYILLFCCELYAIKIRYFLFNTVHPKDIQHPCLLETVSLYLFSPWPDIWLRLYQHLRLHAC